MEYDHFYYFCDVCRMPTFDQLFKTPLNDKGRRRTGVLPLTSWKIRTVNISAMKPKTLRTRNDILDM